MFKPWLAVKEPQDIRHLLLSHYLDLKGEHTALRHQWLAKEQRKADRGWKQDFADQLHSTSAALTSAASTSAASTSASFKIGGVLSRLGGYKNSRTRFLGGRKVSRARFEGVEGFITGECNSLRADCERGICCWSGILGSIGCKGFRLGIDDWEGIVVLEGLSSLWIERELILYLLHSLQTP